MNRGERGTWKASGPLRDWTGRKEKETRKRDVDGRFQCAPYLSVYSENTVDVFDVNSMEWIQTVPLKKVFDMKIV
ncbi:Hypothetical predicted protein [Marmota monax]|uniref:Uncharacterized protein n=1 Tax=Marmota monax TaxID=9995 RepID=A0A5E4D5M4_MARMO|nr:Hypothetical predicted protein [Marmota monax]